MRKESIGVTYLHPHTELSIELGLDSDHVIVDRKDWEQVVKYLREVD